MNLYFIRWNISRIQLTDSYTIWNRAMQLFFKTKTDNLVSVDKISASILFPVLMNYMKFVGTIGSIMWSKQKWTKHNNNNKKYGGVQWMGCHLQFHEQLTNKADALSGIL